MKSSVARETSETKTGMERIHNIVRKDAGTWALLLTVLVLCLCAAIAGAQTVPNVVISQVTTLAALPNGGALAGTNPAGSSMAVDSAGNLYLSTTYGGTIAEYSPGSTTATSLGKFSNGGAVAIDPAGNLYLGQAYSATVIKVPLVSGTLAAITSPGSSTPTCTGNDTTECALPFSAPISGVVAMVFDSAGDLFFTSENGGTDPDTIFECTAACVLTGTPAPVALYAEPAAVTEGSGTANWQMGGVAVDPWGDVFFTDSLLDNKDTNGFSYESTVKELTYSAGAYASTPSTLYTLTDSSPADNDDQLVGVVTDSNGVLYFVSLYDGIYAFPNNNGTVDTTTVRLMSNQGAKVIATDGHGSFFAVTYSGGDTALHVGIGALTVPASSVGSSSTANATIILNDEGCSPAPVVNLSALEGTASTTEFAAATTGSCSTVNGTGASYKATVTFTPAFGGTRTATLNATEAGGPGSSGTATVTGFATGQLAPPTFSPAAGTYTSVQTVSIHDSSPGVSIYYTTDGSTPTTGSTLYSGPLTVSSTETINAIATSSASGVTNSDVSSAAFAITLPVATPTFSPAGGSYAAAQPVTISDANSAATIYYTTNGTTPTTSSTVYSGPINVSSSAIVLAIAAASGLPNSAVASATYQINSATYGAALSVVMTQATQLGTFDGGGALPGGSPSGNSFAVDSGGNLITGNSYGGKILEFAPGATTYTVLGSYNGNVEAVAIDPSGNLYISVVNSGNIVKVPLVSGAYAPISAPGSGTPTCTGTDTVECVLPFSSAASGVVAMTFDSAGDLFFTSTNGSSNPNSVLECTAACVRTGSPVPTVLFAESTTATPEGSSNTALWFMGGIAVDPWGDVFFTDSLMDAGGASSGFSYQSAVRELTYSGGAYSTTPKMLHTLTDSSPGTYDDQLVGVATDANGTVYFSTEYDGVFAFPNNKGVVDTTTEYTVSTQGAKMLTLDSKGNAYVATYSNSAGGDVAMQIAINNIALPNAAVPGSSSASNITTILNDGACSTNPVVAFSATENGASSTEFSANTTGSCSSTPTGGSSFATAVNFTPTVAGSHTGVLTAVDTVNGGIGAANVLGITSGTAAEVPTFSPAAGTYTSVQTVTISDVTPGATIYYTTDGSTPSPSSTKYTGAISVAASETIQAIAVASGLGNSPVATAAYTLNLPVAQTPVISVASGTYTSIQTVKISDATLGAKIYYTTDGSTPTASSTLYKNPLSVSTSETLNVVAIATGYAPSTATATYTINLTVDPPTFSPAGGTFTSIQTITLADTTPNSAIYYTTDGSTPTTSSTLYTGPIQVLGSETINAIGSLSGYADSPVATATFTLNLPPAATPTISLGSGTYTVSQPVTISDTTTGATIYYTTDGTTPTTGSNVYAGALTLKATETLKAIAVATGYSPSAVATSAYTVNLMSPGFALSTNPSSLTIPSTASFGVLQLTLQPVGGFTGAVMLSCTGLPPGAACGFSNSPVNLTNYNQPQTVTVTISTGQTAMLRYRSNPLVPGATLALAICFLGFRKRRGIQILLLAVLSVLGASMVSGCGSSGPGTSTSTVTVTATAGSVSSKTTVSVTMNH
jgi:hypothetical protein